LARDEFDTMNEAIMAMHDPLAEIPQLIQDISNPTARLAAAYASLGKDSTASLEKAAEEAKNVYDLMVSDAESSTHDRLEAERRMWEAQIAADQAAGRTISKAAKDRLKEIEVELGISLSNQQKLWQDFQKQVGSILSGLQHSVVGNIFDQLFGKNNNDQLDKEAAKVRADLAERTAAWEQYQLDVAAQIELISQTHAADLEKQIADLQASLEERRADWEQYQSDVKDKLEEFKIAQDEKLEEERASLIENLAERSDAWDKYQTDAAAKLDAFTAKQDEDLANRVGALRESLAERAGEEEKYQADAIRRLVEFAAANDAKLREQQEDLTRSLNQKRADYFEYVADVGEKLATLREVSAEKLEEEIANLKKSFEAKSKAYDEYVTDVRKKIARITEDVGEQIDDEGRDTRRGIDDKKRAYEREERDINDKINRELAKGRDANMAQVASWKQSLADKKEDLDLYVARAEEDLIEFTDDHKREAEQQTADLQAELARRAQAQAEAQVEFNNNVTEATTSSARRDEHSTQRHRRHAHVGRPEPRRRILRRRLVQAQPDRARHPQGDRGRRRDAREDLRGVRRALPQDGQAPPGACVHAHHRPARPRGRRRQGDPQVQRQRGRLLRRPRRSQGGQGDRRDRRHARYQGHQGPGDHDVAGRLRGAVDEGSRRAGLVPAAAVARVDARRRAGRPVLTDREALNAWLRQAPFFRSRALAFIIDALIRITNTP
jgi:hypothetical protein